MVVNCMISVNRCSLKGGTVDDDNANKLKSQVFTPVKLGTGLLIGAIVVGGFLILLAIGFAIVKRHELWKRETLL